MSCNPGSLVLDHKHGVPCPVLNLTWTEQLPNTNLATMNLTIYNETYSPHLPSPYCKAGCAYIAIQICSHYDAHPLSKHVEIIVTSGNDF